jgi:hypothetical protein
MWKVSIAYLFASLAVVLANNCNNNRNTQGCLFFGLKLKLPSLGILFAGHIYYFYV